MQTYTHYLITAVIDRKLKDPPAQDNGRVAAFLQRLPPLRSFWFLLGSVAPDLPLISITIYYILVDLALGCVSGPGSNSGAEPVAACIQPDGLSPSHVGYLFRYLFFNEPWVKAAHNVFHAPIPVLFYIGLGFLVWRLGARWGAALFWFGAACLLHTALDIPVHYDDGPLLLFPLDWQLRFYSPVSYWDPARYGTIFAIVEHLLALGLLIYLLVGWWQRRRRAKQ